MILSHLDSLKLGPEFEGRRRGMLFQNFAKIFHSKHKILATFHPLGFESFLLTHSKSSMFWPPAILSAQLQLGWVQLLYFFHLSTLFFSQGSQAASQPPWVVRRMSAGKGSRFKNVELVVICLSAFCLFWQGLAPLFAFSAGVNLRALLSPARTDLNHLDFHSNDTTLVVLWSYVKINSTSQLKMRSESL